MSCGEADFFYDVHRVSRPRARKEHRCCACKEAIPAGHVYAYTFARSREGIETYRRCLRCQVLFEHLVVAADWDEAIDPHLACGHTYEENFGEPPPAEIEALAFMTADEAQAVLR